MKYIIKRFLLICLIFSFAMRAYSVQAQSKNSEQALKEYLTDIRNHPNDNALRKKIIEFVKTMNPAPAIPKEAERFMFRGAVAMESAKDINDYKDSIAEFEKATLFAPWLAQAYRDLGIAQNKAELNEAAINSLKLYLFAAPNASDTKNVERLIDGIVYRIEKAAKEKLRSEDIADIQVDRLVLIEIGGEVKRAGVIRAPESRIPTLTQAIALAGGFTGRAAKGRVVIRRRDADGTEKEIKVDVKALLNNRTEDVPLEEGDKVFVPKTVFK